MLHFISWDHALRLILAPCLLLLAASTAPASDAARSDWYPIDVHVWEPPFNTERRRTTHVYVPLEKAAKRWRFCALIPHLKDAYWLAVNYGLVAQAKALSVDLTIFEAGGYERLDVQRRQFEQCLQRRDKPVDGIIVGAITERGLEQQIAQASKRGLPVLDLINGIDSPHVAARSAVDYYDMAYLAGEYIRKRHPDDGEISVAWFPGPEGAGWVARGDAGFRAALEGSEVRVVATRKGDTGKATQAKLIRAALDDLHEHSIDYIAGTTVSAEAAVSVLRSRNLEERTDVVAYYFGPGVGRGIRRGSILAAPTDAPVIQARIAVDTLTRILDGKPYFAHVSPHVQLIDRANVDDWDSSTTLAPRGFRPVFSVGE